MSYSFPTDIHNRDRKLVSIQELVSSHEEDIDRALPAGVPAEYITKLIRLAALNNAGLWSCSSESLVASSLQTLQLELCPDGLLGGVHLVPYGNKVQLHVGYRGYIRCAMEGNDDITKVNARLVFPGDTFTYHQGVGENLFHKPAAARQEPDNHTEAGTRSPMPHAVYSLITFADGQFHFEVLWQEDVARIQQHSNQDLWKTHPHAMWTKMAVKQALMFCPRLNDPLVSMNLRRAEVVDEKVFSRLAISSTGEVLSDGDLELQPGPQPGPGEVPKQPPAEPHARRSGAGARGPDRQAAKEPQGPRKTTSTIGPDPLESSGPSSGAQSDPQDGALYSTGTVASQPLRGSSKGDGTAAESHPEDAPEPRQRELFGSHSREKGPNPSCSDDARSSSGSPSAAKRTATPTLPLRSSTPDTAQTPNKPAVSTPARGAPSFRRRPRPSK